MLPTRRPFDWKVPAGISARKCTLRTAVHKSHGLDGLLLHSLSKRSDWTLGSTEDGSGRPVKEAQSEVSESELREREVREEEQRLEEHELGGGTG